MTANDAASSCAEHDSCAAQVFVAPKGLRITPGHLKQALPGRAIAAQYEPSTRTLMIMFTDETCASARLGFYSFDSEFMRLQVRPERFAVSTYHLNIGMCAK